MAEQVQAGTFDELLAVGHTGGFVVTSPPDKRGLYISEEAGPWTPENGGSRTFSPLNYSGVGNGIADDSAAFTAAGNAASAAGGVLYLPGGYTWLVQDAVVPAEVPVVGDGYNSVLKSTGHQIFAQTGVYGTDYGRLSNFRVSCAVDMAYDNPLFKLTSIRNLVIDRIYGDVAVGTGTVFALDQCYDLSWRNIWMRTGRYRVPWEIYYTVAQQLDTIEFDNFIQIGSVGGIFRGPLGISQSSEHTIRFAGYKVSAESEAVSDRDQVSAESTASGSTLAAATTMAVQGGDGTKFAAGMPVVIDYDVNVEVAEILSVATDTLTFTRPLRFAHANATPIIAHGYALAIANCELVESDGFHFEGHPIGILASTGKGWKIDGSYVESAELIRICGAMADLTIGPAFMRGCTTTAKNVVVSVPSFNSNGPTRLKLEGPFRNAGGSAPATTIVSGTLSSSRYEVYDTVTSLTVPRRSTIFPVGDAGSIMRSGIQDGTDWWYEFFNGSKRFVNRGTGPATALDWVMTGSSVSVLVLCGSGSPEGVQAARVGSLWLRYDGGTSTTLYIKETGTGNTGWKAVNRASRRDILSIAHSCITETFSRLLCGAATAPVSGTAYGMEVGLRAGDVVSGVQLWTNGPLAVGGATGLLFKTGIWKADGTLLASSNDLSGDANLTNGSRILHGTFSGSYTVPSDGQYFIGFIYYAGTGGAPTAPTFIRSQANTTGSVAAGLSVATGFTAAGLTDIGTITIASANSITYWAGAEGAPA